MIMKSPVTHVGVLQDYKNPQQTKKAAKGKISVLYICDSQGEYEMQYGPHRDHVPVHA